MRQLREIVRCEMSHFGHPDMHMSRVTRDEAGSMAKLLQDEWTNSFDPNEHAFSSSMTGTLAIPEPPTTIIRASSIA